MKNTTRALLATTVLCFSLATVTSAQAALESRLSGQAVYDTELNITWIANAALAIGNTFGLAIGVDLGPNIGVNNFGPSMLNDDATMTWGGALKWVGAMNAANYLGYNDWRLPTAPLSDSECSGYGIAGQVVNFGYNCSGSELGHFFYNELGGIPSQSISTSHNSNYNLFQGVSAYGYWTSTEYDLFSVWSFNFENGNQYPVNKDDAMFAFVVRTGDVAAPASTVPVPAAAWLLGSGLLGLIGFARKNPTCNRATF